MKLSLKAIVKRFKAMNTCHKYGCSAAQDCPLEIALGKLESSLKGTIADVQGLPADLETYVQQPSISRPRYLASITSATLEHFENESPWLLDNSDNDE